MLTGEFLRLPAKRSPNASGQDPENDVEGGLLGRTPEENLAKKQRLRLQ